MCDPNDAKLQDVCHYAKGVANATGVHYGAAHVEIKAQLASNGGRFIKPVMMEIGARLSGGRKAAMTQAAYQNRWDPFRALIKSHLGEQILEGKSNMRSPPLHVQHWFLPVEQAGRIRSLHSVILDDDGLELETLHSHYWLVKPGDLVEKTTDITSCAGFVWLVGDKSKVEKDSKLVKSSFRIEFK